jgi:hypothetical protein
MAENAAARVTGLSSTERCFPELWPRSVFASFTSTPAPRQTSHPPFG